MHEFIDIGDQDIAFVTIHKGNESQVDFQDIKIAPVILLLHSNDEIDLLNIDKMIDGTVYKKYDNLTYKIGKAIRVSELINDELQKCIRTCIGKIGIENLVERNAKCRELKQYDFSKLLTFMQLKQILSCIVKTEKRLWELENLNSAEKRNDFTKTLTNFIVNRDFFVHGTLHFLYPEFVPILKVTEPNQTRNFFHFKDDLIKKTILHYTYLQSIIANINFVFQQKDA